MQWSNNNLWGNAERSTGVCTQPHKEWSLHHHDTLQHAAMEEADKMNPGERSLWDWVGLSPNQCVKRGVISLPVQMDALVKMTGSGFVLLRHLTETPWSHQIYAAIRAAHLQKSSLLISAITELKRAMLSSGSAPPLTCPHECFQLRVIIQHACRVCLYLSLQLHATTNAASFPHAPYCLYTFSPSHYFPATPCKYVQWTHKLSDMIKH